MEYAEVLIDQVTDALDRPFHYHIPPELQGKVKPGCLVKVPFGARRCQGYVLRLLREPDIQEAKEIMALAAPEPLLQKEQLALISWLAHRYYCRRIEAVHALLPAGYRRGKTGGPRRKRLVRAVPGAAEADLSRAPAQQRLLRVLLERGPLPPAEALKAAGAPGSALKALQKKGLLSLEELLPEAESLPPEEPPVLQEEQQAAYKEIRAALAESAPRKFLLHGITGSGKTEVYLRLIRDCLEQGKGAILLVPEIALTPQMIEHFQRRFPGKVALLHSALSPGEKVEAWNRIREGRAPVVLGPRSAVFAPLEKLGLIILDEEHENSYKQEEAPRYHAREVAWWRTRYHRGVLVLGSATPSLESYYEGLQGRSAILTMSSRVTPGDLPPVEIVDMRRELKEGHRLIFSRRLLEAMEQVLGRGEQVLLFLNRRGFASFVLCRECGYVARCPRCAVSLTLHLEGEGMICHYCSYRAEVPRTCPGCGGVQIRYFGAGTERVEKEVRKLFPGEPLVRMDSDTTTRRGSHQQLYRRFRAGEARILIGTQMIAKGFNFPGVTLVGVITADTALNLPDFRAGERTFQLLTQVSGRAGRGPREGRVIIQTYHPRHYSILAAAEHDYLAFSQQELQRRRELSYPPFTDLIRFLFIGEEEEPLWAEAEEFAASWRATGSTGEILGPAPAPLFKLKNYFRIQIILKGERLAALAPSLRRAVLAFRSRKPPLRCRLSVDFNPQMVL